MDAWRKKKKKESILPLRVIRPTCKRYTHDAHTYVHLRDWNSLCLILRACKLASLATQPCEVNGVADEIGSPAGCAGSSVLRF